MLSVEYYKGKIKLDFTINVYRELLLAAVKAGYNILTVKKFLKKKNRLREPYLVIRHDVDRWPQNALKIAEIESSLGISTTYYFRNCTFKKSIVKRISAMGHEIGYHYESLVEAKGDYKKASELFNKSLHSMREIVDISTICAHGNVLVPWKNLDMWKIIDIKKFNILGEAYLDINGNHIYVSDVGRGWNHFKSTFEFIETINQKNKNFYINAHPDKWAINFSQWMFTLCWQGLKNCGRKLLNIK